MNTTLRITILGLVLGFTGPAMAARNDATAPKATAARPAAMQLAQQIALPTGERLLRGYTGGGGTYAPSGYDAAGGSGSGGGSGGGGSGGGSGGGGSGGGSGGGGSGGGSGGGGSGGGSGGGGSGGGSGGSGGGSW